MPMTLPYVIYPNKRPYLLFLIIFGVIEFIVVFYLLLTFSPLWQLTFISPVLFVFTSFYLALTSKKIVLTEEKIVFQSIIFPFFKEEIVYARIAKIAQVSKFAKDPTDFKKLFKIYSVSPEEKPFVLTIPQYQGEDLTTLVSLVSAKNNAVEVANEYTGEDIPYQ